ncbi:MAG TPA: hypothetical protein VKZ81_33590 [Pseudonocardia sp.]|uniref:hypothetical protein n=1 Tax=Pseudonocardia sp. TaxID=60912 RepID=UPI002B4B0BDD|nr:hypothetical protein [Pseudonocardia sp.]HLU60419.1 hypothetical protein [Pseudonocardia sp.]
MAATPGAAFYAAATSLRSIALAGVLLVVLVRAVRSPRAPLAPLLVVTGLVQLADAVLHLAHGVAAPAACALLLAGVALGSVPATRRGRRGIKRDVRALTWEHD